MIHRLKSIYYKQSTLCSIQLIDWTIHQSFFLVNISRGYSIGDPFFTQGYPFLSPWLMPLVLQLQHEHKAQLAPKGDTSSPRLTRVGQGWLLDGWPSCAVILRESSWWSGHQSPLPPLQPTIAGYPSSSSVNSLRLKPAWQESAWLKGPQDIDYYVLPSLNLQKWLIVVIIILIIIILLSLTSVCWSPDCISRLPTIYGQFKF